jgi:hypothetical protein
VTAGHVLYWYVHLYNVDDVAILAPETRNEAGNLHPIITLASPVFALSRPISCSLLLLVPSAVQRIEGNHQEEARSKKQEYPLASRNTGYTGHTDLLQTPQHQTSNRCHQLLAILFP